jgi:phosphoribulokinase
LRFAALEHEGAKRLRLGRRRCLHDPLEAAPYNQDPGTFTAWEDLPADTDLLF